MNKIIKVGIVIAVVGFTIFIIGIIANIIDPDRVYSTKPYGRGVVHYENEFAHWMKGIGGLGFFIGGFVVMWGDNKEKGEQRIKEKIAKLVKEKQINECLIKSEMKNVYKYKNIFKKVKKHGITDIIMSFVAEIIVRIVFNCVGIGKWFLFTDLFPIIICIGYCISINAKKNMLDNKCFEISEMVKHLHLSEDNVNNLWSLSEKEYKNSEIIYKDIGTSGWNLRKTIYLVILVTDFGICVYSLLLF